MHRMCREHITYWSYYVYVPKVSIFPILQNLSSEFLLPISVKRMNEKKILCNLMWNKPLLLKEISERWFLPGELITDYESHLYFLLENMMVQSKQHMSDCSGTKTGTKLQGLCDKWAIILPPCDLFANEWILHLQLVHQSQDMQIQLAQLPYEGPTRHILLQWA